MINCTIGLFKIAFQISLNFILMVSHRFDHHSATPAKYSLIPSHASDTFVLTVSHRLPNHSVIAPQFWKIKIAAVTAATTPAIIPASGNKAVVPIAVIIPITTEITGANAESTASTPAITPITV